MRRPTTVQADGSDLWMNSHGVLNVAVDNVLCARLASAANAAMSVSAGDSIDRGLALLAALRNRGFGVIYQGEPTAGMQEVPR